MSEGRNCSKSEVIRKVERIVCDCVNKVLCVDERYSPVSELTIYKGTTNAPFSHRIARGAVFSVAHDSFGVPYTHISRYSRINIRNVLRSVKVYKDIPCSDVCVNTINTLIMSELKKFPII